MIHCNKEWKRFRKTLIILFKKRLPGRLIMDAMLPEGTSVRKAIKWISQMRTDQGKANLMTLIDQACVRFNLSPKDSDFLHRFFTAAEASSPPKE
jgi:hypothetical protein